MIHKKLKWERVDDSFDLSVLNPKDVDTRQFRKLLQNVERDYPDYKKPFSSYASQMFHQWLDNPNQSLPGPSYALLSNWFLTASPASKKKRAQHALGLWKALFGTIPTRRLTSPKRNDKILKEEFDLWWEKQVKCQRR